MHAQYTGYRHAASNRVVHAAFVQSIKARKVETARVRRRGNGRRAGASR